MPGPALDTPLENSPEGCCWLCVHQTIESLSLPDISSIVMRKVAWPVPDDKIKYPCIITAPAVEAINPDEGTNESDDIQYTFMVAIVAAANRDITIATAGWLFACMRTIRKAFLNRTKSSLPGPELPPGNIVNRVVVEPGAKYIDPAIRANLDAAYLLVRFNVRETRT